MLVTELVKAIISVGIYLVRSPASRLWYDFTHNFGTLGLYCVPAALYCLYNNLTFINLQSFDPTTYYLLLQLRVVITGIIYQCFFRRKLTFWQWFSLAILTLGCMIKHWARVSTDADSQNSLLLSFFHWNLAPLLLQVLCSCIAGVYNEYLLKSTGSHLNIMMIHNIYLYVASILINLVVMIFWVQSGANPSSFSFTSFTNLLRPTIIAVILNNAFCGVITSFFLKNLNSILKTFASALELVFTAILCYFFFFIPIDSFTVLSILLVSYATWLYFQNPVVTNSTLNSNSLPSKFPQGVDSNFKDKIEYTKIEEV